MKKKYTTPEMNIIELSQFDVITTSGENPFIDGGAQNKDELHWSGPF